jgi:hypothetical protein
VFWQAYPPKPGARTGPVEDQIEALLDKGFQLDAIVAGARAYAAYLKAKPFHDSKYTREPKKWLIERGWLDNYTTLKPTTPPQASAKAVKASQAGRKPGERVKHKLTKPQAGFLKLCQKEKTLKKIGERFKGRNPTAAYEKAWVRVKKWARDNDIISMDGKQIILHPGRFIDFGKYWEVDG